MSESKRIWVLWRTDGEPPCLLQVGTPPRAPGSGDVYEVTGAANRTEAQDAVRLSLAPEPNEDTDGAAFLAWRKARRQVGRVVFGPKGYEVTRGD